MRFERDFPGRIEEQVYLARFTKELKVSSSHWGLFGVGKTGEVECFWAKIWSRLEVVQISQICDVPAATFIIPMPVEKGQAGGGVEFLTRMMPVPLAKIPATQVVPQDVKARHANTTTALRNLFRILRGRHRMGLLQPALPNHARMEILRGILCS
jgi:hypothetical protein